MEDGLAQIVYHSKLEFLTYKVWDKFARFAAKEGHDGAPEANRVRGLPDSEFKESYVRYGKALIVVDTSAGEDSLKGLPMNWLPDKTPI